MPRITFILTDGSRHEIEGETGETVMELGRDHDLGLEGTCGGSLACATCHVVLKPEDYGRFEPPVPEEVDMLDFAIGVRPTSRLGCQLRLDPDLDGLEVTVPLN